MKRQGFTLAEVLTTLMVIGVVAAMTIPTLMNSTKDQQDKVAYKKAMSVLGQASQLLVAQEVECAVTNSAELAECYADNVLAGTMGMSDGDGKATTNVVTTADGMAYAFFYYPGGTTDADGNVTENSAPTYARDIATICGEAPKRQVSVDSWSGKNDKCYVIVDVNGMSKGTKAFTTTTSGAFSVNKLMGTEQYPFTLNASGVTPIYDASAKDNATYPGAYTGYGYIYGDTDPTKSGGS